MTPDAGAWGEVLREVIDASHLATAADLPHILNSAGARVGIRLALHLADLPQVGLWPVDGGPAAAINGTLAGRAFRMSDIVTSTGERAGGPVLWVPVVDGTERLGVVGVSAPAGVGADDAALRDWCWSLASLIGHLVVAKLAYSDFFHLVRRPRPLSVASELLWQLLPPQTFASPQLALAAVMEPFDRVGGDGFDYAVDGGKAYVAVFDASGHDLHAGLITSAVLAATRRARRAGADLLGLAAAADAVVADELGSRGFCTALLASIDVATGDVEYVLAGHPPAVVIRGKRAVTVIHAAPRPPLGVRAPGSATGFGRFRLEPGDRLLLHTDGVTEARRPDGELFGLDRLVDLTERHEAAGLSAPETVRRVMHAVLQHQLGRLQDDATLLLVEWSATASLALLPGGSQHGGDAVR